jgi:putative membrane protein
MNDIVRMVANFLLTGLSVVIVAALLPGMKVERYRDAVVFAVVVGLLNVLLGKALTTLPLPPVAPQLSALVVGFFVNGLIFLVAKKFVDGVEISGCFVAAIAALLVAVSNSILVQVIAQYVHV